MKKWEVINSSVVYKNKYFSIVAEKFYLGDGSLGKYYIMKNPDFVAAIAVEDESIYFVEMDRYTL